MAIDTTPLRVDAGGYYELTEVVTSVDRGEDEEGRYLLLYFAPTKDGRPTTVLARLALEAYDATGFQVPGG